MKRISLLLVALATLAPSLASAMPWYEVTPTDVATPWCHTDSNGNYTCEWPSSFNGRYTYQRDRDPRFKLCVMMRDFPESKF
jgi:hypothetical protein